MSEAQRSVFLTIPCVTLRHVKAWGLSAVKKLHWQLLAQVPGPTLFKQRARWNSFFVSPNFEKFPCTKISSLIVLTFSSLLHKDVAYKRRSQYSLSQAYFHILFPHSQEEIQLSTFVSFSNSSNLHLLCINFTIGNSYFVSSLSILNRYWKIKVCREH